MKGRAKEELGACQTKVELIEVETQAEPNIRGDTGGLRCNRRLAGLRWRWGGASESEDNGGVTENQRNGGAARTVEA